MYKSQEELFNLLSGAFNVKLRLINKEYNYIKKREEFNENEVYYALIEARYINAHVEYSNYKPRQYYLLNDNNEFILDVGPFNKETEYYALID